MSEDEKQVQRMQKRMDRLFNEMIPTIGWVATRQQRRWRPPTDVYETEEAVIVKVEIAGMSEQDFCVSLSNRDLTISGARRDTDCKLSYQQLEIPYGQTRSYADVARAIQRPNAVRAVGAANGSNPLAIVVPCHRVIASDGSLGGYGGGLDLKGRLLAMEQAHQPTQGNLL